MKNLTNPKRKKSNSGFIIADFLFSFVLVIAIGILIFAFTFSLATIEISQYIVWTTARNYSAGHYDETLAAAQARRKFENISSQFPLLTGRADSSWFTLTLSQIGDLARIDTDLMAKITGDTENKDNSGTSRHPWIGASAKLKLKLFASIKIPFLGKVAEDDTKFEFPIRAFVMRHPSIKECQDFFKYENRFQKGIKKADAFDGAMNSSNMGNPPSAADEQAGYIPAEDNGC